MSVTQQLYGWLSKDAAVAPLLTTPAAGAQGSVVRIWPLTLPEEPDLPAITYQVISAPRLLSQTTVTFSTPRVRLNCWDRTYDGVVALAQKVTDALDRRTTPGGMSLLDNWQDLREPDTGLFRRMLEFIIWTEEAA